MAASIQQRPTPQLLRATTDYGPRRLSPSRQPGDDENWELRHGWEEQYNSEEYLTILNSVSASQHTYYMSIYLLK